jgi:tRNA 2-selenouridine synthase
MSSKGFSQNISRSKVFVFLFKPSKGLHKGTQRESAEFMSVQSVNIERFLELAENVSIADVRSPSEFDAGHIPGAVNIPLFDDQEREAVGTKYKKEGRLPAIIEGLRHTGPAMASKLEQALNAATDGRLLVHCWRGGMRSEAMAWLFSLADLEVFILDGGYKSYRRHILEKLSEKRNMIILGGMTGSSKTNILHHLKSAGQQIIDLEKLANHKGSAFGALGQLPQPSTEQFANLLFDEVSNLENGIPCWIEDESRNIGSIFMPEAFYQNMQELPVIELVMDVKLRLPNLMKEYSCYPPESLNDAVRKISKRLGGDNTRDALSSIEKGDFAAAIEIVLHYYDKAYHFGLRRRNIKNTVYVSLDTDNVEENAAKVLKAASEIKW